MELTYPTGSKENHLQKCLGRGYVRSQQGRYIGHEKRDPALSQPGLGNEITLTLGQSDVG